MIKSGLNIQSVKSETIDSPEGIIEKQRLMAINEIVATVNHEINNPLTAILYYADVLETIYSTDHDKNVSQTLQSITDAANKIKGFTHKLSKIKSSHTGLCGAHIHDSSKFLIYLFLMCKNYYTKPKFLLDYLP